MNPLLEGKITWALAAMLTTLATAMVAFGGFPGWWKFGAMLVGSFGAGAIAWRAYVQQPPPTGGSVQ